MLPSLFVSHGTPSLALEGGATGENLRRLGKTLPRPEAVLVVSSHWETREPCASISEHPKTLHGFQGYAPEFYAIRYPVRGMPSIAFSVIDLLHQAGWREGHVVERGLDHGAWIPMRFLYPEADVPVLQLSIQFDRTTEYHYRLGQTLRSLRKKNVLIMGSGSLTNNVSEIVKGDLPPAPYVDQFRQWMVRRLRAGKISELLRYRTLAPHAERAHPFENHLLPLFVALGAANAEAGFLHIDNGTCDHVLALDSFIFGKDIPKAFLDTDITGSLS